MNANRPTLALPPRLARTLSVVLACLICQVGCRKNEDGTSGPALKHNPDAGVIVVSGDGEPESMKPEIEPNTIDGPQLLVLPAAISGRIDAAGDIDTFSVTVTAPGNLVVRASGAADADLALELLGPDGKSLGKSDNGPKGTPEGFPGVHVALGTHKIVVREFVGKKAQPRAEGSQPYELRVTIGAPPSEDQEREPNDTPAFAGTATIGGVVRGFLGRKDKDVWRVPLVDAPVDTALAADLTPVRGVSMRLSVLSAAEEVLWRATAPAGAAPALRSFAATSGSQAIFLVVEAVGAGRVDEGYELRVTWMPTDPADEIEPNDTRDRAGSLPWDPTAQESTVLGTLPPGDTDLWRVEAAPTGRRVAVVVEPPADLDVSLAFLGEDGAVFGLPVDATRLGGLERIETNLPAGAALTVRVTGARGSGSVARYQLRTSLQEDAGALAPGAAEQLGLDPTADPASDDPEDDPVLDPDPSVAPPSGL